MPKKEIKRKSDISDPTNKLTDKIQTLELNYVVFGCACANWVETKKYDEYQKEGILSKKTIFIEPASENLKLPQNFDAYKNKIIVTGQFYEKPDFPKGTPESEEEIKKAPIFRYTKMKIEKI